MLKELEDALVLVAQMPEAYQRKALTALVAVVDEHEDWVSNGSPEVKRWGLMKYARDPRFAHTSLQKTIKRLLNTEE